MILGSGVGQSPCLRIHEADNVLVTQDQRLIQRILHPRIHLLLLVPLTHTPKTNRGNERNTHQLHTRKYPPPLPPHHIHKTLRQLSPSRLQIRRLQRKHKTRVLIDDRERQIMLGGKLAVELVYVADVLFERIAGDVEESVLFGL